MGCIWIVWRKHYCLILRLHNLRWTTIFSENILRSLVSKSSITEWRDVCRSLGYRYHKINLHCSAEHWKMIRVILVQSIGHNSGSRLGYLLLAKLISKCRWQNAKVHQSSMTNVQRTMAKVFNYSLREMKSGALCAMVDRAHKVSLLRSTLYSQFWIKYHLLRKCYLSGIVKGVSYVSKRC